MSKESIQTRPLLNQFGYSPIDPDLASNFSGSFKSKISQNDESECGSSVPVQCAVARDMHPFGSGVAVPICPHQPPFESNNTNHHHNQPQHNFHSNKKSIKVKLDHTKFLAWISFLLFLLIVSATIIVLAEFERLEHLRSSVRSNLTKA